MAKSVAVIGAGPSGAIAVDALMQEKVFNVRVFERQEKAGGCWYVPTSPLDVWILTSAGYREMMRHRKSSTLMVWQRVQLMRH
jgi:cation diffusion facilitator CzcD-associated flavoprotein CzcO